MAETPFPDIWICGGSGSAALAERTKPNPAQRAGRASVIQ